MRRYVPRAPAACRALALVFPLAALAGAARRRPFSTVDAPGLAQQQELTAPDSARDRPVRQFVSVSGTRR